MLFRSVEEVISPFAGASAVRFLIRDIKLRAKATPATLARMGAYMAIDTATGTVPIAGDIVDTFFPGQLMAARALQKHIESTHWVEDTEANARATGDHEMHEARVQKDKTLKRIIYLHD